MSALDQLASTACGGVPRDDEALHENNDRQATQQDDRAPGTATLCSKLR